MTNPNQRPQSKNAKYIIKDAEGNYDIDGVSLSPDGVVVSGDAHTPTEEKEIQQKKKLKTLRLRDQDMKA